MKTNMRSAGLALPILVALTLTVILGANGAKANAQQVVFLVQYADSTSSDDALTEVGQRRAKALAGQNHIRHFPHKNAQVKRRSRCT